MRRIGFRLTLALSCRPHRDQAIFRYNFRHWARIHWVDLRGKLRRNIHLTEKDTAASVILDKQGLAITMVVSQHRGASEAGLPGLFFFFEMLSVSNLMHSNSMCLSRCSASAKLYDR